ncbi:MAG TPA: hypothetical protein VG838_03870 [Opitutaceae bacterium]|nr:hypothetical protein [Opitutaceae bacterium]
MKTSVCLLALLAPSLAFAAATGIDTVVNGIPAGASEVIVAIDTVSAAAPADYEDPAQQAAAAQKEQPILPLPAAQPAAAAAADPAAKDGTAPAPAAGQRRGRRGRFGGAGAGGAASTATYRTAVDAKGATSLTVHTEVPAGTNYRVRAVAIKGSDPFPTVLAGGKATGLKVEADKVANTSVLLTAPVLKLAAESPTTVAAGASYTLIGTITDPSSFLGSKTRMRVWFSSGSPPAANYDGVQVSTVKVTMKEDLVTFNFDLTAPKQATTLYFQLGEVSPDFVRKDGSQAAFLVLPDLSTGAKPLQLRVEAAKPSVAAK